MAQNGSTGKEKLQQGLLIVFVGICCVLIALTLAQAIADSNKQTAAGLMVNVGVTSASPTPAPNGSPTPTHTLDPNMTPTLSSDPYH